MAGRHLIYRVEPCAGRGQAAVVSPPWIVDSGPASDQETQPPCCIIRQGEVGAEVERLEQGHCTAASITDSTHRQEMSKKNGANTKRFLWREIR